jgi:hypothetical protein
VWHGGVFEEIPAAFDAFGGGAQKDGRFEENKTSVHRVEGYSPPLLGDGKNLECMV